MHLAHVPRRLLVTGFGPFGTIKRNPSFHALEKARNKGLLSKEVKIAELPVTWQGLVPQLENLIRQHRPTTIVGFGVGPWLEPKLHWELIGQNKKDKLADAVNHIPAGTVIEADGPDQLPTTLEIGALQSIAAQKGFALVDSKDAGKYLCNYYIYRALRMFVGSEIRFGFIHTPLVVETDEAMIAAFLGSNKLNPEHFPDWETLTQKRQTPTLDQLAAAQAALINELG